MQRGDFPDTATGYEVALLGVEWGRPILNPKPHRATVPHKADRLGFFAPAQVTFCNFFVCGLSLPTLFSLE